MTTLRPFRCEDMFHFNNVNLDPLTETYGLSFYLQYLAHWPEYFQVAESSSGVIMGYSKCIVHHYGVKIDGIILHLHQNALVNSGLYYCIT